MTRLALAAASVAASLAACTPEFDPASEVRALRVLAVRAEPPELAPPGAASAAGAPARAAIDSLVSHPAFASDPSRRATVLHLACTPSPGDPAATPCAALAALEEPAALLAAVRLDEACAAPGLGVAGAVTFAGVEACGAAGCAPAALPGDPADPASAFALPAPSYEVPAELGAGLAALPAGAAERILGVEVVVLSLALDAPPEALAPAAAPADACAALAAFAGAFGAAWEAHPHVASVKRLRVRGPDATDPPNRNPAFDGIALGRDPLPPPDLGAAPVAPGARADLLPLFLAPPAPETYVRRDAAGAPIEARTEEWVFSWFATGGSLDELHTRSATEAEPYTAPAADRALVHAVLRDLRGGVAWRSAAVQVEPR